MFTTKCRIHFSRPSKKLIFTITETKYFEESIMMCIEFDTPTDWKAGNNEF